MQFDPNAACLINQMPADIFNLFFRELDPKIVSKVRKVCRLWNTRASSDEVWKEKFLHAAGYPAQCPQGLVHRLFAQRQTYRNNLANSTASMRAIIFSIFQ